MGSSASLRNLDSPRRNLGSPLRVLIVWCLLFGGGIGFAPGAAGQNQTDLRGGGRLGLTDGQTLRLRVIDPVEGMKFRLCPRDGRIGRRQCVRLAADDARVSGTGQFRASVAVPDRADGIDCTRARFACEIRVYGPTGGALDRIAVDFTPPVVCGTEQPVPADRASLAGLIRLNAALTHPDLIDVVTSFSVWIEGYGEIAATRPNKRLVPASNQKLYTAFGAYTLLPGDHTFTTTIGVADTDLVLIAGGDPTLRRSGEHSIEALAQMVAESGITEAPRLVIDASRYDSGTTATGWPDWTVPRYAGPLSAFTLDDNDWTDDADYVANPALGNGRELQRALEEAGVIVDEVVVEGAPSGVEPIGALESAPLPQLLDRMLRFSDNEIADNLIREIGKVTNDEGSMAGGIRAIDTQLGARCAGAQGTAHDGSGLSYANARSAREWQQMLRMFRTEPWFDDFWSHLPVAGGSGTLRRRFGADETIWNVRGKTGTVFGGRALSGYATTVGGRPMVFSIVINGDNAPAADALDAMDAVISAAVRIDAEPIAATA
ncbi:MAG: D-alanyl-D-alanine carboxypeptidase/D-alanyl-D-alanine-endopeptidase [Acidimicrobiales bacterium]|nr:D-alanyl-D-alanine carboxypeptidase/D-alanyl-D-alanine-endopeptidase [Acidimicrobiales bacterium]